MIDVTMTSTRPTTATILFSDLVNSTELLQRVGDAAAQRVFETHHRLLRDAVAAHSGDEVKWTGDGLMVAFDSATAAVR
jgi:class 3 adenylate cyclase